MSPNTDGLVSVVVPTYNDDEYLPRAIDSIERQQYEPIEVIIVDSGDSSVAAGIADRSERITYVTSPPDGPGAARNVGVDEASGEYIGFLDADDEWLQRKVSEQVEALVENGAGFCFAEMYNQSPDGTRTRHAGITFPDDEPPHVFYFRKGTGISSQTVVVRRDCLETYRFDESLEAREDPHLWTRILREHDPVKVPKPLAVRHVRADSLTSDIELVWQSERQSINDLADRFDELALYRAERLAKADYRFAKRLLYRDRHRRARRILRRLRRDDRLDARGKGLLLISLVPFGHATLLDATERGYRTVRSTVLGIRDGEL